MDYKEAIYGIPDNAQVAALIGSRVLYGDLSNARITVGNLLVYSITDADLSGAWRRSVPRVEDMTIDLYDRIGGGYGNLRRQDSRIAAQILAALGNCSSLVNVGAGTGSYEPSDREVIAVEPSMVMIHQRPEDAAPVIRASATNLPFNDASFDAALAVLTIHHWPDLPRGLAELRRVARKRVVILTFDTSVGGFWLLDYFPEIAIIDRQNVPRIADIQQHLGKSSVITVPIPHDCTDGFLCAYWRRPHSYLNATIRSAISMFSKLTHIEAGIAALHADLQSGEWLRRYGEVLQHSELDLGYRLVVVECSVKELSNP